MWYKARLHNLHLKPETKFEGNVYPAKWVFTIDVRDDSQDTKKATYQFTLPLASKTKPLRSSGAKSFNDLITNEFMYDIVGGKLNDCLSVEEYDGSK